MRAIKKIINIITVSLLLYGCGYSLVNKSSANFNIIDISLSGEKRINYNLKNRLMINNSPNSVNKLSLSINTQKQKLVKNKNIKNEITSYQLVINSKITYKFVGKTVEKTFNISETGDYKVSTHSMNTLSNEKKLVATLTDNLIDKIYNRLNKISDDN